MDKNRTEQNVDTTGIKDNEKKKLVLQVIGLVLWVIIIFTVVFVIMKLKS